MPDIFLEPTIYIKAQPQDAILASQQQSQSSVTTALNEAQIKPTVSALTKEAVYAQLDQIAKRHLRPMSDKEYFYLVDILKKNGYTDQKLFQLHDLFATAIAILGNYYAFRRPEELDPIVEEFVNTVNQLPAYSIEPFNKALDYFYSKDWFGKTISEAADMYSREEKLIFGSVNIAFVDEYNTEKSAKQEAQDLIDAGGVERTSMYAREATGNILQTMAPAIQTAVAMVDKAQENSLVNAPVSKNRLTFEEQVHPMLRYGLVARKR